MDKISSAEEFETLVNEIAIGASSISISRSISRQFFFRVRSGEVKDFAGLSTIRQKFIIHAMLIASIVLLLICLGLVIMNFGWLAIIAAPLIGIFWTVLAAFTTETGSYLSSTIIYVIAMIVASWMGEYYLMLFASSLYLFRMTHILAEQLLSHLVIKSFNAYTMLAEHIVITRDS